VSHDAYLPAPLTIFANRRYPSRLASRSLSTLPMRLRIMELTIVLPFLHIRSPTEFGIHFLVPGNDCLVDLADTIWASPPCLFSQGTVPSCNVSLESMGFAKRNA
jgi:hypothetical protein